jgi:hypothetical protein
MIESTGRPYEGKHPIYDVYYNWAKMISTPFAEWFMENITIKAENSPDYPIELHIDNKVFIDLNNLYYYYLEVL